MTKKEEVFEERPISVVATGQAAHDPLSHPKQSISASKVTLNVYAHVRKMRPVDINGFSSWASKNAPLECTAEEWATLFEKFKITPIRG